MPRIFGHNLIAFILAVVVFYAVGFIIYGLLFSELWMSLAGYTEATFAGQEWKMALGPVMPILAVLGLAFVFQKAGISGFAAHLKTGVVVAALFAVSTAMYGYAYGPGPFLLFVIDTAHMLIAYALASVVLAWRK